MKSHPSQGAWEGARVEAKGEDGGASPASRPAKSTGSVRLGKAIKEQNKHVLYQYKKKNPKCFKGPPPGRGHGEQEGRLLLLPANGIGLQPFNKLCVCIW